MSNLPFSEVKKNKSIIRTFDNSIEESELKWHYDLQDRVVIPLNKNDWLFQKDNQLPFKIDHPIFIKAKEWHRVIKGRGNLIVEVFFVS